MEICLLSVAMSYDCTTLLRKKTRCPRLSNYERTNDPDNSWIQLLYRRILKEFWPEKLKKENFIIIYLVFFNFTGQNFQQKTNWIQLRGCSQTTLTRFWLFLTTYPPLLTFSTLTLTKSGHFWTIYLPCLVNVVCEQPHI